MKLLDRLKEMRAERLADREAIARAAEESRRAENDRPKSVGETVDDVAGQYPPAP